jgi:hypothetical protein
MGRNRLAYTLAALLVALMALPTFAYAARGNDVIRDCQDDGHIDGSYSQQDYADAESNLNSDVDQYSDCRDAIKQARAAGAGGGSNGSGGAGGGTNGTGGSPKPNQGDPALETKSGAYAPTQSDKAAYDKARAQATTEATLPGGLAIPSAGDFKPAGATNSIPLPVLLALVAVGLLVAASTALVARRRLPDLTSAARRLIRR